MATLLKSSTSRVAVARSRPSLASPRVAPRPASRRTAVQVNALQGPPGQKGDRKGLSRDEEPEEYWSSKSERDGANPFKDPLAIIGIVAILFPFLFVLVAAATGVIDLSVYR